MTNVKVGLEPNIKVRVGQQNSVKIVSSVSGSAGGKASISESVIGGIASVTSLYVSGISTFVGISTFKNDVFINGDLYVSDDLVFDEFTARNAFIEETANIENLYVSGISTFVGVGTFLSDLYVGGNLYVSDDLVFDEFTSRNASITGIASVSGDFYYGPYNTYGIPYFNDSGLVVSTNSPTVNSIDYTNYILTTDDNDVPAWSNAIDGGFY